MVAAGHAIGIPGGHIDPEMRTGLATSLVRPGAKMGIADGVDEVVKAARYQIKRGARVIKISATAEVLPLEEGVGARQMTEGEIIGLMKASGTLPVPTAGHSRTRRRSSRLHGQLQHGEGIALAEVRRVLQLQHQRAAAVVDGRAELPIRLERREHDGLGQAVHDRAAGQQHAGVAVERVVLRLVQVPRIRVARAGLRSGGRG